MAIGLNLTDPVLELSYKHLLSYFSSLCMEKEMLKISINSYMSVE
jgi:hypothetical protein